MVAGLYPGNTNCFIPVIPCHSTTVLIHLILSFGLGVTSRLSLVPHISAEAKGLCMHLDLQQDCVEHSMLCAIVVGMPGCKGCLENELTESLSPRSVLFCFSHLLFHITESTHARCQFRQPRRQSEETTGLRLLCNLSIKLNFLQTKLKKVISPRRDLRRK